MEGGGGGRVLGWSPESERYYHARVKQTGITLWPPAAPRGLLCLLIHPTAAGRRWRGSVLEPAASQWSRAWRLWIIPTAPKLQPHQRLSY